MNDYRERIAAFLSQYVTIGGSVVPADDVYIKDAIQLIIENGVMTKDEMRAEALRDYSVIINDDFFKEG